MPLRQRPTHAGARALRRSLARGTGAPRLWCGSAPPWEHARGRPRPRVMRERGERGSIHAGRRPRAPRTAPYASPAGCCESNEPCTVLPPPRAGVTARALAPMAASHRTTRQASPERARSRMGWSLAQRDVRVDGTSTGDNVRFGDSGTSPLLNARRYRTAGGQARFARVPPAAGARWTRGASRRCNTGSLRSRVASRGRTASRAGLRPAARHTPLRGVPCGPRARRAGTARYQPVAAACRPPHLGTPTPFKYSRPTAPRRPVAPAPPRCPQTTQPIERSVFPWS